MRTEKSTAIVEDTIIAVSTPPGRGALGVVRVSGPRTVEFLKRHCRPRAGGIARPTAEYICDHPRRAVFCDIHATPDSPEPIDEGLVIYFPGPASYTGEDTAELSLHGNPLLLRKFVLAACEHPDLRPAEPGEFTRRAYLSGKMDLTRAEAVRRVIDARGEYELAAGRRLMGGELSRMVSRFRSALISLKAETEAEVDFATEDLTFESREARANRVRELITNIEDILERARATARLASGFQVALVGVPNAGKSSLLNLILGRDRAIVSAVPGTTRDAVSEEFQIEGVPMRIVDTAGLRDTDDEIEKEGIRRSRREMDQSRIILHVIDGSLPPYPAPDLPAQGAATVIDVINKADILHPGRADRAASVAPAEDALRVCCLSGQGLDSLRARLSRIVSEEAGASDPLLLEDRHEHHFRRILEALQSVLRLWDEAAPDEITALEIDRALEHAGEITGRVSNEEILGRIFSMFCVGK